MTSTMGLYKASRDILKDVVKEVRRKFPEVSIGKAWVSCNEDRTVWNFRGPNKYLACFEAPDAFLARAKGWMMWLQHMERK